jgi:xanthine dehydrogenase large subunit
MTTPPGSDVVGLGLPTESALLHVTGTALFADDELEPQGMLHIALGLSPVPHGRVVGLDVAAMRALPGVVAVLTAADIPGENDFGTIVHDEPILAGDEVSYAGQPVFAVVASDRSSALRAASAGESAMRIDVLPAVLDLRTAHAAGQHVVPPFELERTCGTDVRTAIESAPHRLQGSFSSGSQEHVYLETHVSIAVPTDEGGMDVRSSTQNPSEVQALVAQCLGLPRHLVEVECRRMGGAFGGKQHQAAQFACIAAIAAHATGHPAKLRLGRAQDDVITGKRHAFWSEYDVGFDEDGRLLGVELTLVAGGGFSAGLSGPVLLKSVVQADGAYWLPNVAVHGFAARTHTQSSTAMRGFGAPQGALATEMIIDSVARRLGRDPADVRAVNYYRAAPRPEAPEWGTTTPYGQSVDSDVLLRIVDELMAASDYRGRRAEIAAFNAESPVLKRGIALTPVKFGLSYELRYLNQAGALVHVFRDGSVLVNHSGTEMGQGLNIKVLQVVAQELGVSLDHLRITETDTDKVANTSATAASTGSDLNCRAAQKAAHSIRTRLAAVAASRHGGQPGDVVFRDNQVVTNGSSTPFPDVVADAYAASVQLWADGFYQTPGLDWDEVVMRGHPFKYYCYGASVSEVLIDVLTGESRVLRADLLHDVGRSLNPAVDLGQVEGGYVQGMGWFTMEDVRWDDATGTLLTLAPTTYKIPTANDVPPDLRVRLFEYPDVSDTIHVSKAVGEPPLLLAFSAFLAIRDAISSVGGHRVDPPLRVPATAEEILRAIEAVRAGT